MTETPEQDASFWETFKYGEPAEDDVEYVRADLIASAGMVTVPVDLLRDAEAMLRDGVRSIFHADQIDAILRQAQGESTDG